MDERSSPHWWYAESAGGLRWAPDWGILSPVEKVKEGKNMAVLPEKVSKAWDDREAAVVLTTVNSQGVPNAIYATCVSKFNEETLVVADNYFHKTRENILSGSRGSILFLTKGGEAYQIKGTLTYCREGAIFDDMKRWNPTKHPGHAAAALSVEEVYAGSERLL